MELITKKQFNELANYHANHCISIFLPTKRAGEEVNGYQAKTKFKNALQSIDQELEQNYGLSDNERATFLKRGNEMLEDRNLWRNLSDGLAIFIGENYFKYKVVPVYFEAYHYIADHFYVRPLIPLFNGDGRFFLMTLSLQSVDFYECTRYTITKVYIEDIIPTGLEEVVGKEYEEKSLQFRSSQGPSGGDAAMYHGQGRNSDKDKSEMLTYFRAIDKGLMTMLHDEDAPMIIHCVDYLFPIYQDANSYQLLYDQHISGNPEEQDMAFLQEQAWAAIGSHFEQKRKDDVTRFKEISDTSQITTNLEDIVTAAVNGRIDTLFIENRADKYGVFDPATQKVRIDDEKQMSNASLLNLATVKTFQQNGKVYLMEENEMPADGTIANAILRY